MNDAADHPWAFLASATAAIDPASLTADINRGPVEADSDREACQDAKRAETSARAKDDPDTVAEPIDFADENRQQQEAAEAAEAAKAALARQDEDFQAFGVSVCFYFYRHEGTGGERPAADWRLADRDSEDLEGTALPENAVSEIINAISPSFAHFSAIGFLRADGLEGALMGGLESPTSQPTFYVVCAADAATEVASLGEREPVSRDGSAGRRCQGHSVPSPDSGGVPSRR